MDKQFIPYFLTTHVPNKSTENLTPSNFSILTTLKFLTSSRRNQGLPDLVKEEQTINKINMFIQIKIQKRKKKKLSKQYLNLTSAFKL